MSNKMLPSGISVRVREDLIDGVARTQTTLIVDPLITLGGHRVTMDDIGAIGYGKIDQGKASEEIISWTGITDNNTTYTLTGCTWGINFHNTGNDAKNIKRHVSGATFAIMTDMHYITEMFRDNDDNIFTNTNPADFVTNELKLGDGTTDTDKVITAQNGTVNEPFIKYNKDTSKWNISNDGVNTFDPEDGGSGLTAGDAILIDGGAINVKTKETSGVHIDTDEVSILYQTDPGLEVDVDGKLGVKVKPGTGLVKDADGIYNESIDPDNIIPQANAKLVGGDVTTDNLTNFQNLAVGTNDGKFTANIDGVEYEDVALTYLLNEESVIIDGSSWTLKYILNTLGSWQEFTTLENQRKITRVEVRVTAQNGFSGTFNFSLRKDSPTGTILATSSIDLVAVVSEFRQLNFTEIDCLPLTKYYLVFDSVDITTSGTYGVLRTNYDAYPNNNSSVANSDIGIKIYGKTQYYPTTLTEIATNIQSSLRAATGKQEQVIFDQDHFEIIGDNESRFAKILKLTPPTTGTDISGVGYLDLADNATEVFGTGEDYNIVRLDKDGKMLTNLLKEEELYKIVASDSILISANTPRGTDSLSYTKLKEIEIIKNGSYRVYFGLRRTSGTYSCGARIYKNDVALGTIRTSASETITYYSEDFSFIKGDKVQLYAYGTALPNYSAAEVSNFQLRGVLIPAGESEVIID